MTALCHLGASSTSLNLTLSNFIDTIDRRGLGKGVSMEAFTSMQVETTQRPADG